MSRTIRFHLDEHGSTALSEALRRYGIDVTTTVEANLRGKSDPRHLDYSRTTGRVVVTHDDDFLVFAAEGVSHAGIAYCHSEKYELGELIRSLVLVWECLDASEMIDRVEYL